MTSHIHRLGRRLLVSTVPLIIALAATATAAPRQQPDSEQPPVFHGRQVAPVMSYLGAPWLEREGRDREEGTEALIAKLGLEPGHRVADIGCGSGYFSRRMAREVAPGGYVFAIDLQPKMLQILKRNAASEGIANIVPVLGDPDDPFLPAGEIDWILLVDVYHELQQPAAMLERMLAALAPGGRVALAEYRLEDDSGAHIKLEHRMSVKQVRDEWESAGFELIEVWEELPTQHLFIFGRAGTAG